MGAGDDDVLRSTVAPRLSALEMKMYSLPWARNLSTRPELTSAGKTSPWPGGYHSSALPLMCSGSGSSESLRTRG